MATIILTTYRTDGRSIFFEIGGTKPDPFPRREVEIKRTADAIAARDAYAAEVRQATTERVAVSVRIKNGHRKPAGFDAATRTPAYLMVNDQGTPAAQAKAAGYSVEIEFVAGGHPYRAVSPQSVPVGPWRATDAEAWADAAAHHATART